MKYLLYFLYAIILLPVFLYLNFPYKALKERIEYEYRDRLQGVIKINSLKPKLPLGLSLNELEVYPNKTSIDSILSLNQIQLKLKPFAYLYGKRYLDFRLDMYGGSLQGAVSIKNDADLIDIDLDSKFIGLDLEKYNWNTLLKDLDLNMSMVLNGDLRIKLKLTGQFIKEGKILLNLDKGRIEKISFLIFRLPQIKYNDFFGDIDVKQNNITVNKVGFAGKDFNFMVTGDILLKRLHINNSPLKLALKYKISPSYEKKMGLPLSLIRTKKDSRGYSNIKIRGTIAHPKPVL